MVLYMFQHLSTKLLKMQPIDSGHEESSSKWRTNEGLSAKVSSDLMAYNEKSQTKQNFMKTKLPLSKQNFNQTSK